MFLFYFFLKSIKLHLTSTIYVDSLSIEKDLMPCMSKNYRAFDICIMLKKKERELLKSSGKRYDNIFFEFDPISNAFQVFGEVI